MIRPFTPQYRRPASLTSNERKLLVSLEGKLSPRDGVVFEHCNQGDGKRNYSSDTTRTYVKSLSESDKAKLVRNSNYKNTMKDTGDELVVASSEIKHDDMIRLHKDSRRTYDRTTPPISAHVITVNKDDPRSKEEDKTSKVDNHPETSAPYGNTSQSTSQEKQCLSADGYSGSDDSRSDRQFLNLETMERTTFRLSSEAGRSCDEMTIQASLRQFKTISDLVDTYMDPGEGAADVSCVNPLLHTDDVFKYEDQKLGPKIPHIVLPKAQTKRNKKSYASSEVPSTVNGQQISHHDYRLAPSLRNQVK
ncbi:uncharacterized protein LOC143249953 [Tachypleus tridentatus]|uniref:uncharacterized protein LOC143249953 n=1 Tax=Tachypleus tridentatus TaxID=6853 RepID=UPI003FD14774